MAKLLFATRESDSLRSVNPGMSQPSRGLVLGLGLGAAISPSRIAILRACLRARRTASAFAGFAFRGLLVSLALFHLPEETLALHLLFELSTLLSRTRTCNAR